MSNPCVTVDNITDAQIKELRLNACFCSDDTLAAICEQALAEDALAITAVVAEINDRAQTAEQRRRRATTTAVADLIIELQRATSEYKALVAEISARIVDAAKGE